MLAINILQENKEYKVLTPPKTPGQNCYHRHGLIYKLRATCYSRP